MRLTDGHELRMNFGENGVLTAEEQRRKPSKTDDEQRANKEERGPLIMTSKQGRTKEKIIIEARVKPEKVLKFATEVQRENYGELRMN